MKRISLCLFYACSLSAQNTDSNYSPPDCAFGPNGLPTIALPCSSGYTDPTLPITTLRYGYSATPLDYNLTVPAGPILLTLSFVEPNKTGIGQRVFTVKVGNLAPLTLDLFKLSGGAKQQLDVPIILETQGVVHISLKSVTGNPLISGIKVTSLAPPAVSLANWFTCISTPNCQGLQYVVLNSNGVAMNLLAFTPGSDFTYVSSAWQSLIQ